MSPSGMWNLAALMMVLMLLHSHIHMASCIQTVDLSDQVSIGSIEFKGSKINVFELDGIQFAEPSIQFAQSCGFITYNHLYRKYQISIPVLVGTNALQKPIGDESKRVGLLSISKLETHADEALGHEDSKVWAMLQLENPSEAKLLLMCDDFDRCQALRSELLNNPTQLQQALQFTAAGVLRISSGGLRVKFDRQLSSNPPPITDCLSDKWVVFQRRVDGSQSFVQNWDTYVKGFGNPHKNYWMGLNQLFAYTASNEHSEYPETARCEMRVSLTDHANNGYWGHYKTFQVMGPGQNYRLRVMDEVVGTNIQLMSNHHEKEFSTYDRDNSGCPKHCSRQFGFGGWWFPGGALNANGAYTTDGSVRTPSFLSAYVHNQHLPMKTIVMSFRCK